MRTIREGGLPIDFSCAAMRNLVRVVDFFPFFYLLGGIVIVFSKYSKRLGDYAAGTIVVKERAEWKGDLHAAAHEQPKITRYAEAAHVKNIELVTPQEFEAISRFLERQAEFQSNAREQLAAKIAQPLMARLGIEENTELRYVGLLSEIHKLCVDERGMR